MSIEVTCYCGKRFRAKDEHAGLRGTCPVCRRILVVPVPIDLAPVDVIAPNQAERFQPSVDDGVPSDPQVSLPLSERDVVKLAASEPRRPFWRDPVVVFGAAIPTLILAVFFGYLAWPKPTNRLGRPMRAIEVEQPTAPSPSRAPTSPSLAYKLAVIEAGEALPENDRLIVLMGTLLHDADRFYADDEEAIAGRSLLLRDEIRKANGVPSLLEILDGSTRWQQPGYFQDNTGKFSDYAAMYLLFRVASQKSHSEAIRLCRAGCRAVSFGDPSLTREVFAELLNNAAPGQRLAIVEARRGISVDDPWATRYQTLLEEADAVYPENIKEISEIIMVAYAELRKIGKNPFPDQILEGSIEWARSRRGRSPRDNTYADFLKRYAELRIRTDMAHESIIKQITSTP